MIYAQKYTRRFLQSYFGMSIGSARVHITRLFSLSLFIFLTVPTLCAHASETAISAKTRVVYLPTSPAFLAAFYETIRSARTSVDMMYWGFEGCGISGKVLVKTLIEQKKKYPALRVRIIVDKSSLYDKPRSDKFYVFARKLTEAGIELRLFNDVEEPAMDPQAGPELIQALIKLPQWRRYSLRVHSKYVVTDADTPNARYIVGSRNLSDDYFGYEGERVNFIDRDLLVYGKYPSRQPRANFEELWNHAWTTPPKLGVRTEVTDAIEACGWTDDEDELEAFLRNDAARVMGATPVYSCPRVQFVGDTMAHANGWTSSDSRNFSDFDKRYEHYQRVLKPTTGLIINTLKGAKRVVMENYSFLIGGDHERLGTQLFEPLKAARADLVLFTNYFVDTGEWVEYPQYLRLKRHTGKGVRILSFSRVPHTSQRWEQEHPAAKYEIHSKVFIGDSKDVIVSSYNIDPRSYSWNGEAAALVRDCPAFAAHVESEAMKLYAGVPPEERAAVDRRSSGLIPAPKISEDHKKRVLLLDRLGFL